MRALIPFRTVTASATALLEMKQECIPVGCVPNAAVAVTGGLYPPQAGTPPEQAPPQHTHTHPGHIPLNFPLGCGHGPDPPHLPPWVWP